MLWNFVGLKDKSGTCVCDTCITSASNLEQAANPLCAQANSASYPQRDGNE